MTEPEPMTQSQKKISVEEQKILCGAGIGRIARPAHNNEMHGTPQGYLS